MKEELLIRICDTAGFFNENNVYQLCFDNNYDYSVVFSELDNLIKEEKIVAKYYSPDEQRFSLEPIGHDSYLVYDIKTPKLTPNEIDILMQGI